MDSTTNDYTCQRIGNFTCTDENGTPIVPENHFRSNMTGSYKRYMRVLDGNGYSFHRFYLGVDTMTLKLSTEGVGYKASFCGDEMVAERIVSYGYTLQLDGCAPVTLYKDGESFVSGKTVKMRVDHFDIENHGETKLYAKAVMKLDDGTVIESLTVSMTMREMMEKLDASDRYLDLGIRMDIADLIDKYPIMKTWKIPDLVRPENGMWPA